MRGWLIFLATLLLSGPAALHARPGSNDSAVLSMRAKDAVAVMQRQRPASEVFNAAFLAEVPPARLAALVAQLEALYGKLLRAENLVQTGPGAATISLRFEYARATANLVVEPVPPRRISGLLISQVTALGGSSPQSLEADLAALPGIAGFSVARLDAAGPVTIRTHRGDQPLAVGSTFKLWVLDAVAEEVAQGRLSWSQAVPIGPRSLPSGITQDWAPGTPASVEQLATLMISISDNTATDTLIRLVRRERVETRLSATRHSRPELMQPFLMTSEMFNLKLGPQSRRDAYARSDSSGRAQILAALPPGVESSATGNAAAFSAGPPVAIDSIEWFATTNDVVRVLDALRRRSDPRVQTILGVSPGMSPQFRSGFSYAGFKGGSEPGVLNLSWLLRRSSGTWYAVTTSWVNKAAPLQNGRLELLAQKLFALAP